jgi:hypothetical protein
MPVARLARLLGLGERHVVHPQVGLQRLLGGVAGEVVVSAAEPDEEDLLDGLLLLMVRGRRRRGVTLTVTLSCLSFDGSIARLARGQLDELGDEVGFAVEVILVNGDAAVLRRSAEYDVEPSDE